MASHVFRSLAEITMDIYDLMELLGLVLRVLGASAFGLGAGWVTSVALKRKGFELAIASVLGLLGAFVLIGRWISSPGTLGGFGLGAAVGLFIWGLSGRGGKEEDDD